MGCPLSPEEIIEDFKSFYYDTALSAHETTLTTMESLVGSERLIFGSDFPAVSTKMAEWYTKQVGDYYHDKPKQHVRVMSGTASQLFPRFAET